MASPATLQRAPSRAIQEVREEKLEGISQRIRQVFEKAAFPLSVTAILAFSCYYVYQKEYHLFYLRWPLDFRA